MLDIGCAFGVALLCAQLRPELEIHGFHLSQGRVDVARRASERVGATNAHVRVQNATQLRAEERFHAIYMHDVIHHVPAEAVEEHLREVRESLAPGGSDAREEAGHGADVAMTPSAPPRYLSTGELGSLLAKLDFEVERHAMVDLLPYAHVLYVARPI